MQAPRTEKRARLAAGLTRNWRREPQQGRLEDTLTTAVCRSSARCRVRLARVGREVDQKPRMNAMLGTALSISLKR
jgi:hypothetical protein